MTGRELRHAAKDCRGTAAGIDGWTPEELCLCSDEMFEALARFFRLCEEVGKAPTAWHFLLDKSTLAKGNLKPLMGPLMPETGGLRQSLV